MAETADQTWTLTASDGELTVHTGVSGRAARMGHRLTLLMAAWRASVTWSAGAPVAGQLIVEVDSLQVRSGEGGVTPLSGPEKGVARTNALNTLGVKRFPQIEFQTESITPTDTGFLLAGPVTIHGVSRPTEISLVVSDNGEAWQLTCSAEITQSDFGIKPYSMMLGAMKVDDTVTVSFDARAVKDGWGPTG